MSSRRADTDWRFGAGRNAEGDKFAVHYLVHGSGRVLGKVFEPLADELMYRATFYCAVPAEILDTNETFDFVDAESAKAFLDGILAQFDPLAKPKPKEPAAKETAETGVTVPRTGE